MTTSKYTVLWIDDDEDRRKDAENLCDRRLQVSFELPTSVEPNRLAQCDLLLVDYKLDRVQIEGRRVPLKGPAVVGLLRSASDDVPAYMVSSASSANRSKFSGLTWFEDYFTLAEIQDLRSIRARLKRDIAGYRGIRAVKKGALAVDALLKLLKVPKSSEPVLRESIPSTLKASWLGHSVEGPREVSPELGFARWVRRALLTRPGPLLPSLHAATRVGLPDQRYRVSRVFSECRYDGIFADHNEPRWWTSCNDDVVVAAQQKAGLPAGPPYIVGPRVFRLKKRELVKCAVCGDPYPETVAREVSNPTQLSPVHIRCSRPDVDRDFMPFFEEERVYEGRS